MLFVRASKFISNKASREEALRSSQGGDGEAAVEGKDELGEKINAMSRRMLWCVCSTPLFFPPSRADSSSSYRYPMLYSIVVVPVSICRLSVMAHNPVPLGKSRINLDASHQLERFKLTFLSLLDFFIFA